MRTNPATGIYSGYYRLVESYRNENGRVCHRTMLNAGYIDDLNADQLNLIQKILSEKVKHCNEPLFRYQKADDKLVNMLINFMTNLFQRRRLILLLLNLSENQEKGKTFKR